MPWDEFRHVMSLNWRPVELTGNAIPSFLSILVNYKTCRVFASGTKGILKKGYSPEYNAYNIGGIRLYRDSSMEPEGFKWNADEYFILSDGNSGNKLMVSGPFESPIDHWTDNISASFKNVEIQYFQYPNCPDCGAQLNRINYCCEYCGWKI